MTKKRGLNALLSLEVRFKMSRHTRIEAPADLIAWLESIIEGQAAELAALKAPSDAGMVRTRYGVLTVYPGSFSPQIKLVCSVPWVPHRLTFDEDSRIAWIDLRLMGVQDGGQQ